MKISWKAQGALGEAVSTKVEMCLVDENGKGLCVPVRCKDFLTDVYYSEHHGKDCGMYGFRWKAGTIAKDEPVRVAIRAKGQKFNMEKVKLIIDLLTPFDKVISGEGTVSAFVDEDGGNSIAFEVGKAWTTAPWQISLLTLLLRIGVDRKPEEGIVPFLNRVVKEDNDAGDGRWLKGCLPALKSMLDGTIPPKLAKIHYMDYKSCSEAHHGGGIYAAFTGSHTG